MTITLDGLVRNPTAGQKAGVPVSTKADLATGTFDLASKSIGSQTDATNVQLSPYGQVKSSFVEVQSAGRTLSTPSKISTAEDATKAVQTFTDAFNNATRIINTSQSLTNNSQVNSASNSLKRIVSTGNNSVNLQEMGVSINQDGTLSVNSTALQSAVQASPASVQDTLVRVGSQAVQIAQNELTGTNGSGASTIRNKNQGSKASGQQKINANSSSSTQSQSQSISNSASEAIAAYTQMVSR
jgi:flagellar hook-associated protein 2